MQCTQKMRVLERGGEREESLGVRSVRTEVEGKYGRTSESAVFRDGRVVGGHNCVDSSLKTGGQRCLLVPVNRSKQSAEAREEREIRGVRRVGIVRELDAVSGARGACTARIGDSDSREHREGKLGVGAQAGSDERRREGEDLDPVEGDVEGAGPGLFLQDGGAHPCGMAGFGGEDGGVREESSENLHSLVIEVKQVQSDSIRFK